MYFPRSFTGDAHTDPEQCVWPSHGHLKQSSLERGHCIHAADSGHNAIFHHNVRLWQILYKRWHERWHWANTKHQDELKKSDDLLPESSVSVQEFRRPLLYIPTRLMWFASSKYRFKYNFRPDSAGELGNKNFSWLITSWIPNIFFVLWVK